MLAASQTAGGVITSDVVVTSYSQSVRVEINIAAESAMFDSSAQRTAHATEQILQVQPTLESYSCNNDPT